MKLISLIIVIVVAVVISLIKIMSKIFHERRKLRATMHLIKNGRVIKVQLQDCEIKTNQHYPQKEGSSIPSQVEMADGLFGGRTTDTEPSMVCYLIYTFRKFDGKDCRFISPPIFMSIELLRFHLESKRYTNIYIDPSDSDKYFFDIRFLTSESNLGAHT